MPERLSSLIRELVARRLRLEPGGLDPTTPLHRCGLDALGATILAAELSELLRIRLSAAMFWECGDLAALVAFVERRLEAATREG